MYSIGFQNAVKSIIVSIMRFVISNKLTTTRAGKTLIHKDSTYILGFIKVSENCIIGSSRIVITYVCGFRTGSYVLKD